jgi:acetyl coenzyme A synthetase (ADP forming)-like protein
VKSLDAFFHPRGIAVVGASRHRSTIGGDLFHNLSSRGLAIPVYPINCRAAAVQSVHAYPSLRQVPGPVDLAFLAVPARDVLACIDDCAAAGVRAVVVLSAGFKDAGVEGRAGEEEVLRRVRAHGMRMVGPNCLGILSTDPVLELNGTFGGHWPPPGGVAFGSQSGALGIAILDQAEALGIGVSQFVSLGNKADVSGNDLLEHWEADPRTKVILLYLESLGNPRRFMEVASRVARHKPIVVVKAGRSTAGARAISSHTGALAGAEVAVDALLGQAGVIRTDTMEQLFDVARLLEHQPVPRGRRLAILTNGGGPAIMAADACETAGLTVATLAPTTTAAMRAFLPPEASLQNPVDMIASATPEAYEKATRLLLADPGVDALLVLFVHPMVTRAADVAAAIERAAAGADKPLIANLLGTEDVPAAVASLRSAGIPTYSFPETAVMALGRVAQHGAWLRSPPGVMPSVAVDRPRAERALAGTEGWLSPGATREVLEAYGLCLPRSELAGTEDEAALAAERLGYPVAMKLASSTITHKTEVGGVLLALGSPDEVRRGWRRMRRRLEELGRTAEMSGVVMQEMVPTATELLVGAIEAGPFGHLVGFGLGGTSVELFGDVAFAVAPLTDRDAEGLLERIRGRKALDGYRGHPPVDRRLLVDALLRVSQLVSDHPSIRELDLNPFVTLPDGGCRVVDARIRIETMPTSSKE